jgi:tyrosine-protein phosphatase YwqE
MFGLFKKNSVPAASLPFPIAADMHSHILPGIDDGSPDVETSVALVRGLKTLGIHRACATPHIIGDMFRNNRDTITAAQSALQQALDQQGIEFNLTVAAEYMLDSYFLTLLNDKENILTVRDNLILTEFSYAAMPSNPGEMSFAIITEGFSPILAHPERYAYYHNDYEQYHHLQDLGFVLQVNLLSLTGYYGKEVAKAAHYLVKNNLISFAGTDMHHDRHLAALMDGRNHKIFGEVFEGVELLNH